MNYRSNLSNGMVLMSTQCSFPWPFCFIKWIRMQVNMLSQHFFSKGCHHHNGYRNSWDWHMLLSERKIPVCLNKMSHVPFSKVRKCILITVLPFHLCSQEKLSKSRTCPLKMLRPPKTKWRQYVKLVKEILYIFLKNHLARGRRVGKRPCP